MSKMSKTIERLDGCLNRLNKTFVERIEQLETENRTYREEILRLESIVSELISIMADKTFPKKKDYTNRKEPKP